MCDGLEKKKKTSFSEFHILFREFHILTKAIFTSGCTFSHTSATTHTRVRTSTACNDSYLFTQRSPLRFPLQSVSRLLQSCGKSVPPSFSGESPALAFAHALGSRTPVFIKKERDTLKYTLHVKIDLHSVQHECNSSLT